MTRSPTDTRRAQAWGSERLLTGGSSLRHLLITTTSPPPQRLCHRGTSQHGRWRCAEPLYAWSPTRDPIVPRGWQTVHACLPATSRRVEPTPRNRAVCETLRSALGVVSSCGRNQFHTQKWRVIPDNLCSLLDLLPLAPPFLLNSLHLLLPYVFGVTLF